jgi:hypothetical protein
MLVVRAGKFAGGIGDELAEPLVSFGARGHGSSQLAEQALATTDDLAFLPTESVFRDLDPSAASRYGLTSPRRRSRFP